jgi:hypothetical protein
MKPNPNQARKIQILPAILKNFSILNGISDLQDEHAHMPLKYIKGNEDITHHLL